MVDKLTELDQIRSGLIIKTSGQIIMFMEKYSVAGDTKFICYGLNFTLSKNYSDQPRNKQEVLDSYKDRPILGYLDNLIDLDLPIEEKELEEEKGNVFGAL